MNEIVNKEKSVEEKIEKIESLIKVTKNLMESEKNLDLKEAYKRRIEKQYEKLAKLKIFQKAAELINEKVRNL